MSSEASSPRLLVQADGLGKAYPSEDSRKQRWRALTRLLSGRQPSLGKPVLQGVGFEVRAGESVGIVGVNGAGKSTLLKMIAGVLEPSWGQLKVRGRVSALLELGAGFQPEQSGLENIHMKAALLGISQQQLRQKMDQILEFADIGDAIHRPVKQYSSGMVVRLGFAVVASLEPDLLITDEVLAVGDESFQRKCIAWLDNYLARGGTLLLVSHSTYQIRRLCQQALWLHEGRLHMAGDVDQVTQAYSSWHESQRESEKEDERSFDASTYQIKDFRLSVASQEGPTEMAMGETLCVELILHSPDGREPVAGVGVTRQDGTPIYGVATQHDGAHGEQIDAHTYRFCLRFPRFQLLPGQYLIHGHALDPEGVRLKDSIQSPLTTTGKVRELGIYRLPHEWYVKEPSVMTTTIIIPVFNAHDDLQCCLDSLSHRVDARISVLIIDDASTDPAVLPLIQTYVEQRPSWQLLCNEQNLGFVGTVNRGMRHCSGDVLLLNSDTMVTEGWLERIEACALSDERIATVTPLTNNGEIVSWPEICQSNPWPEHADAIARACVAAGAPLYLELPTAVGFCMWIRRRALDVLGFFDEEAFGKGYGEENDFCQRAQQAGWRNVVCDDAYVAHRGGASFAPLGLKPNGEALEIIKQRYPEYLDQVMAFIRNDPLRERRLQIRDCLKSSSV